MSMDKSAIEQIQEAQTTEAVNEGLAGFELQRPLVAAPSNFELHDLERYLPGRTRYRGHMSTVSIDAFVTYCQAHDAAGARCFVDPEDMDARAVFNLGTEAEPGHADFSARLTLKQTAEFRALLGIDGEKCSQKRLAEWLEDWAENLQPYNAEGEAVEVVRAISAVRRLEINANRREDHEVQDFRASKSALESVEARSDFGMPAGFRFTCVPYQGLGSRSFEVRLSILTGGDAPMLVARIRRLEQQQEAMGIEFMERLSGEFEKHTIETYLGNFKA